MISISGLNYSYNCIPVLRDIDLQISDGEFVAIIGPNGAGKTTTLRILCTVLRPDAGTATVDGFSAVAVPREVQRRIGALPDAHGLYPRLTARENIRYFGRLHGLGGAALERSTARLVAMLEMREIADRRTGGFSHGERLKVAIARALVHDPQNILLDEPTNGLDVMSMRNVRAFIRRLRDEGRTVLFSSHVMQEVSVLCDRIVVIGRGQVAACGTAEELRQQTGQSNLEDAFVRVIGSDEGLER